MENRRRFLRFEVKDFLEIRPLNEVAKYTKGQSFNLSIMGVCFFSEAKWETGQVLLIDYFMPQGLESVKLKVVVAWSELIDNERGYLTGTQIIDVEKEKESQFVNYYFQKLKEKFF
ncbi:MAG: hypothetical protein B1H08_01275 [Candidatus Omnitrophica bacterium 4484_171]|nr:MAG: hypothetical protein B1H08_01275 [Candidatus Omnitrophica bacterium 4484_171]